MRSKILFLACLITCNLVVAQEQNDRYRFTHLTVKDGLAGPLVRQVYQDKAGFMWFGTSNGLQRFDGRNYKTFYSQTNNKNSLPGDDITDIVQDTFGRFWITTMKTGLSIYDETKNEYKNFNEHTDSAFVREGSHMMQTVFTPDGETALVATYNGIFKFNVRTLTYQRFGSDNSNLPYNYIGKIFYVEGNLFIVGSGTGMTLFDAEKNIFYNETNAPVLRKMLAFSKGITPQAFAKDRLGNYWFSLWSPAFFWYRPQEDSIIEITVGWAPEKQKTYNNLVNRMVPDESGNLYLATIGAGIFYLNIQTGTLAHRFFHEASNPNSLLSSSTPSILIDRQKNIWVPTDEGISYLTEKSKFIFPVLYSKDVKYFPSALLQSANGHIWVGTYNGYGLFEMDEQFRILNNYVKFRGQTGFDANGIWDLTEASDGRILICRQTGFSSIDPKTKKQDDYTDVPMLSGKAFTSVREDDSGRWWLGTWSKSFICFDPATRKAKAFITPGISYIEGKDKNRLLLSVYEDEYKFYTFDMDDTLLHREPYHFFNPRYPALMHDIDDVYDVLSQKDKRYMASQHGFYVVNNTTGKTDYYTRSEGLPSTNVTSVMCDKQNRIWVGTGQGLSLYDPVAGTFRNFNEDDRLANQDFQVRTMIQLRNGLILAGVTASLVAFNPDSISSFALLMPPVITGLHIGQSDLPAGPMDTSYRISYKANNLVVRYASLDFGNAVSIVYAYKLEGFDKEWQYAGNSTSANYASLDGGHYTFRVRSSINGIDWVETKDGLSFFVTSPFYKQTWFIVLLVVVVLGILYIFYRIRIQRILEMQRLRNNISKDLHDDVGATMTSISILSEVASQKIKQDHPQDADEMMEQIGSSSRTLLQNLDDIIWSINPQNDPIEKIVLRMKELTAEMLEPNKIRYHLSFDPQLSHITIPMQDRRHLFLIYKEALNNMIKYAGCNNAFLSMQAADHTLTLRIEDDGKGFDKDNFTPGNGLINMQHRAKEMNAALSICSSPGKGSSIVLKYPLK